MNWNDIFFCLFFFSFLEHQKSIAYWSYHWMTKYKPGGSYEVIKPILPFVFVSLKSNVIKKKRLTFDIWRGIGQEHVEHNSWWIRVVVARGFFWLFVFLFGFFSFSAMFLCCFCLRAWRDQTIPKCKNGRVTKRLVITTVNRFLTAL